MTKLAAPPVSVPVPMNSPTAANADVARGPRTFAWLAERGIFVITALLLIGSTIFVHGFTSSANIGDVFNRIAPVGIVAIGMTFVVISGNYLDLSVVAQVATGAVILIGVSKSASIPVAIIAALLVAAVYGLVNGIAVGYFKANAVIVTLSTTYIGLGILRWLSGGSIYFGPAHGAIARAGAFKFGPVPLSALVMVVIAVLLGVVLSRTPFGFVVRAFGSNREATRLSGVSTPRVVIGAFMITAFAATVGGFVLAAYSNTAVSSMSTGFDFDALSAIIIGGTSVFGGRGSILRTVVGVVFVSVLTNVLVIKNVSYGWQQVALGALIVVAVVIDTIARRVNVR